MKKAIVIGIIVVLAVVLILGLGLGLGLKKDDDDDGSASKGANKGYYQNGAVATDAKQCSEIGRNMLQKGGHAVDAAIASLLCVGVVNCHSTGVGGGGFMTVYNRKTKKSEVYDYRETGPSNFHADIFDDDKDKAKVGGLAVGIPGEIRGLKKVHEKYGKLPWKDLFVDSIQLAESGTRIGKHMARYLGQYEKLIRNDTGLSEILLNSDGTMKKENDTIINKRIAATLRILQENPEDLYTGNLAKTFVKEVNEHGGNMTLDDLKNYVVLVKEPIQMDTIHDLKLHTTPLPGGGSVLMHILNMAQGFNFTKAHLATLNDRVLTYHRLVEIFKFSYAMRPHLGDPDTVPSQNQTEFNKWKNAVLSKTIAEEHRVKINDSSTQELNYYDPYFVKSEDDGTTHVSVLDAEGNAVSATDTINYAFGAKFRSPVNGIIYNNEMADFFLKTSYSGFATPLFNAPKAGRRPLSSTCPSILTDSNGDVKMVVGGSGGTRITLSTAWVIMKKLLFEYTLKDAVEDPRAQHTFFPEYIRNEKGYSLADDIVNGLKAKNHVVKSSSLNAIIQGIFVDGDKIFAKSDPRKEGVAAGY